jgi:RNA polymerase sigma factor (sigma-70 family)
MNRIEPSSQAAGADDQQPGKLLEEAFARCQDELLGMLYYMVGNVEDARDALQEAFVKCWRHRQGVPEVANLRAWVFRVALNVARDMRNTAWRRRRKPLLEDDAVPADHQSTPEAEVSRREQLALIRRTLLELRPVEQEVFLLRQNGDMTYEEIAQSINVPVGTVKTRMRLALGKLRQALAPKMSKP